ncbi:hypothetical protein FIBSPDRAFT_899452 [Athelia psychrophila]|uniref:Uncharacterized protein n=1 Tax=Athelia psychrophila TaxID=1759441 RepID=A0A165ZQ41_9AGAM|nr:hypothetical protein FIBSPDRAFT_899452 [Fibularhizoctonia sp. CBS 109695]
MANIIGYAPSMVICTGPVVVTGRRKAAVGMSRISPTSPARPLTGSRVQQPGRTEIRIFLALYAFRHPFQLITNEAAPPRRHRRGALLEPARNRIVATQVEEDGSTTSIIPFTAIAVAFFAAMINALHARLLPVFPAQRADEHTGVRAHEVWHAAATAIYLVPMAYIVLGVLDEVRPMWFYVPSGVLFVLSQLDHFLLNKLICKGVNAKIDGSFVASICETAAVGVVYLARRRITKESWDDEYPVQEDYFPRSW